MTADPSLRPHRPISVESPPPVDPAAAATLADLDLASCLTRLQLLACLRSRPSDVSTLAAALGVSAALVSSHLRRLSLAGLVRCRTVGRRHVYSVDRSPHAPHVAAVELPAAAGGVFRFSAAAADGCEVSVSVPTASIPGGIIARALERLDEVHAAASETARGPPRGTCDLRGGRAGRAVRLLGVGSGPPRALVVLDLLSHVPDDAG